MKREPMEFRSAAELPAGRWQYEPKWDGFRCIVLRDGAKIELTSKSGQPLARYFPELVERCLALGARRFEIDGEIVMRSPHDSFDVLLQRIHPAKSRVTLLAKQTPVSLQVFDLLADDRGEKIAALALTERRRRLELFARRYFGAKAGIKLSPATKSRAGDGWRHRQGFGCRLSRRSSRRRREDQARQNRGLRRRRISLRLQRRRRRLVVTRSL
jgi:ATP-dependent DNA ligase